MFEFLFQKELHRSSGTPFKNANSWFVHGFACSTACKSNAAEALRHAASRDADAASSPALPQAPPGPLTARTATMHAKMHIVLLFIAADSSSTRVGHLRIRQSTLRPS